jgi:hypothetical protein
MELAHVRLKKKLMRSGCPVRNFRKKEPARKADKKNNTQIMDNS